ncbi:MAG: TQO small subunit DoxD [bacterium]|nr:TQO small subunit DoxD [bacterium]
MLSLFPTLFAFKFFAPTIIRLVLGILFIKIASKKWGENRGKKGFAATSEVLVNFLGGIFLFIGLYTQATVVILLLSLLITMASEWRDAAESQKQLWVLMFFSTFTLLVTGAGAFAIDLPL